MPDVSKNIDRLKKSIPPNVCLIAVSKTKPIALIQDAYQGGQLDFGENKVQELVSKYEALPKDIRWHLIGHLQTNKVKYIIPFVYLIHSVDSIKLLNEIETRAKKINRKIQVLLQIFISEDETKFGFSFDELKAELKNGTFKKFQNIEFRGLMGMATLTDQEQKISAEFNALHQFFKEIKPQFNASFDTLSMGMSSDYLLAIQAGSNMIRVGSTIFGDR